jgi:type VI protein secretion system component VasK
MIDAIEIFSLDEFVEPLTAQRRAQDLISCAVFKRDEDQTIIDRLVQDLTRVFESHDADLEKATRRIDALATRCDDLLNILREVRRPVTLQKGDNVQYLLANLPADLANVLEGALEMTRREVFGGEAGGEYIEFVPCKECSRAAVHPETRMCLRCGAENSVCQETA